MNLQRSQSVPLQQFRPGDGVQAVPPPPVNSDPFAGDERLFFRFDLMRSLQLHRRLAIGFAVAGLVLAAAYIAKTWPVYTAESQIYIQPAPPGVMQQGNESRWPFDSNTYDSFIQQQVQNASNPAVLMDALHKLGSDSFQNEGESEDAAAYRLGKSVEVARLGTSYEIAITAKAKDPQLSAQIANAMAASLVERASHQQNAGDPQRLAILQEEQIRVQNQLNADLAEQGALNNQLGMAAVGTSSPDLLDNAIGTTRDELIKARTAHDEAEARFAAMDASQGSSSPALQAESDEVIATDAGLTSMKTWLNQRRAILISQMANLTPNNPEYKQDAEELAKINTSLDSMMTDLRTKASEGLQERLRTNLEQTAGVEAQLNSQLRQLSAAAASATPKLQRANDLSNDILRLHTRYSAVDEELHNLMLQDSVPSAAHLSVTAVAPLHPALSGVVKKALPLALGGILLGLMAALIATNLDSKVYIAADVEHLLGFAPMAALPDFGEVSEDVFGEHLLRLSAAIEHARKQGNLRSCIFTGTASGTGVTTVVTHVRNLLEAMGRPTMLVDANGASQPPTHAGTAETGLHDSSDQPVIQPGSRSTALLRKVAEETKGQQESLVLTDAAPLTISAETEYLARFVDCAIVVIESGVTTRQQLRAAANTLQRLDVGAVGFVLNRVGMANADPAFRHSVHAMESHLRTQSRTTEKRAARGRMYAQTPESEPVTPTAQETASRLYTQAAEPEHAAETTVRPALSPIFALPTLPVKPAPLQQPEAGTSPARESVNTYPNADREMPWWLTEATSEPAPQPVPISPATLPQAPPPQSWERAAARLDDFTPVAPAELAQLPAPEEIPYSAATRLGSLRNLFSSLNLKNAEYGRESSVRSEEAMAQPEIATKRPAYGYTYTPYLEPVPVPAAPSRQVIAQPEFLPPRSQAESAGKGSSEDVESTKGRDRGDPYDEVQILPSWRGQYRTRD